VTIVKTYKQKNITELTVCKESWSDVLMSIITWIALVIGGYLIAKALKFLKQIERFEEKNKCDKNETNSIRSLEDTSSDINEDVIRSNSLSQNNASQIVRPSLSNGPTPWLTTVRNDAYETHRRLSTGATSEVNINVENK
jgi:cytoskeletal protein RodZ